MDIRLCSKEDLDRATARDIFGTRNAGQPLEERVEIQALSVGEGGGHGLDLWARVPPLELWENWSSDWTSLRGLKRLSRLRASLFPSERLCQPTAHCALTCAWACLN
jgi:hypothetical protein